VTQLVRSDVLANVIAFLRRKTRPGEPIFVARAEPLIYFATDTRNPTPYSGVFPGMRDEQERIIIQGLASVRFVVMSDLDQPIFTYYRDELPAVQAYLERHFQLAPDLEPGWLRVLQRGPDRGPTAIDLIERLPTARPWIRGRDGSETPPQSPPPNLPTRQNRRPLAFRLGRMGGGVDFDIAVPPQAVFQADVGLGILEGMRVVHWHPAGTRLIVSVSRGGRFERLASLYIPERGHDGTRWTPLQADLSTYAGEHVTLRLELIPDEPLKRNFLSWWGSPRIALRNGVQGG
jgi:hypothetical protein